METSNKRNTYNKKNAENDFQRALRLAEEFKGLTTNDQIHKRSHGEMKFRDLFPYNAFSVKSTFTKFNFWKLQFASKSTTKQFSLSERRKFFKK